PGEWQRAQPPSPRSNGHTVAANVAGESGKVLVAPTSTSSGACSSITVPPPPVPPTQLWIHVVRMSAQACELASQQLWPPATLVTSADWSGCVVLMKASASA